VAKVNPVKVKAEADKEEKAGRLDKAVQLYRQLLDDNAKDWNTINKIGDLYAKMNKNHEAAVEYAKVADFYAKDGFHLKAIAIWKKINKLDATALDPYLSLADLYAKQGLMMEAKSQYQIVVDEYLKRGKSKDAGDVLRKMAEIDPADLKIRSKLADLYTREGNSGKAIEEMIAIADELNRKGHLAEAVQVLEKGLKIDSSSGKLRAELARSYIVQKNFAKAAEFLEDVLKSAPNDTATLVQLGEAYLSSSRVDDAEKIFKHLVKVQPDNPDTRVQMARLSLAKGNFDAAYSELAPLVDRFLEKGEGDKAASLLQQLVQKSPSHTKTLTKLVDVYRQLKNDRAVASTYSQLTEAYIKGGELEQAVSILEILIGMEPANHQHQSKLNFVRSKLGGAPMPAPTSAREPEVSLAADVAPPPLAIVAPSSSAQMLESSGPLSEEDQEFIEEHLAEGKVFRKYGLIDKAADQFEAVIARFPDHLETRQELLDVYKEKGQPAKAAEQAVVIAQVHKLRGDAEAAENAINEARGLSPDSVPADWDAAAAPAAAPAASEEPMLAADEPAPLAAPEEEIPLEVEDAAEASLEPDAGLPDLDLGVETAPAEAAEELDESLSLESVDAPSEELSLGGEELPLDQPAGEAPSEELGLSDAGLDLEAAPASLPEAEAFEEPAAEPEPEPPPPSPAPLRAAPAKPAPVAAKPAPAPPPPIVAKQPPPPPAAPGLPADLQRVLDEVESYMSLGFVDDAKEALREIGQRYPSHPAILEKLAEHGIDLEAVEEAPEPAPAPPPQAAHDDLGLDLDSPSAEASPLDPLADLTPAEPEPAPEPSFGAMEAAPVPDGGIDLGAELGELFSAQSAVEEPPVAEASSELGDAGLNEMFKEFKKGVDKQLGKEDYDTRYNLGIAYKEMGLVDEAIAEFQLAAKDEGRLLECSSMLGICFMDKGMPKLAVKWFEKGLKAPGRSEEEYQGLRYDLAMAHEASGDLDKALNLFEDLYGQNANFRDVAQKVRDLRAALPS
jgi:tetratricopeptide (TPR) repeat protein